MVEILASRSLSRESNGKKHTKSNRWLKIYSTKYQSRIHCFLVIVGGICIAIWRSKEEGASHPPTKVPTLNYCAYISLILPYQEIFIDICG
jgi:hypothetical protein